MLEGIKQRDGANSKQEAKRQEKGRGWGSGGESGCDSNRGVVVRETDGKKGRWEIRIQTQSNSSSLNQMVTEKCSLLPVTARD